MANGYCAELSVPIRLRAVVTTNSRQCCGKPPTLSVLRLVHSPLQGPS